MLEARIYITDDNPLSIPQKVNRGRAIFTGSAATGGQEENRAALTSQLKNLAASKLV